MLPLSLCRLWQPDRAANAAQDTRSYTTARGTITIGGLSFERLSGTAGEWCVSLIAVAAAQNL